MYLQCFFLNRFRALLVFGEGRHFEVFFELKKGYQKNNDKSNRWSKTIKTSKTIKKPSKNHQKPCFFSFWSQSPVSRSPRTRWSWSTGNSHRIWPSPWPLSAKRKAEFFFFFFFGGWFWGFFVFFCCFWVWVWFFFGVILLVDFLFVFFVGGRGGMFY